MNWSHFKNYINIIIFKLSQNKSNLLNIRYNITILLHIFETLYKKQYQMIKNKQIKYIHNINNNNKLIKFNHILNHKYIIYNFNKYELYKNMLISRLTSKLIYNLIHVIYINKKNISRFVNDFIYIVISKPKIKINLSNVKIKFYYYLPNYKPSIFIRRTLLYYLPKNNNNFNKNNLSNKILKSKSIDNIYKLNNLKYRFVSNIINNILNYRDNKHLSNNLNNILYSKNNNINNITFYNLITYKLKYKILNFFEDDFNRNDITRFYIKNIISNIYKTQLINNLNNKSSQYNNYNYINKNNNLKNNIKLYSYNKISNNILFNIVNDSSDLIDKLLFNNNNPWFNSSWFMKKRIHKNFLNIANKTLISPNYNSQNQFNLTQVRHYHNINNNNNNIPNYLQLIVFSINRIFGRFNNTNINNNNWDKNKLSNILSKFFNNKKVIILPVQLKYEYNNIDILIKLIKNSIDSFGENERDINRNFRKTLLNRKLRLESSDKILKLIKNNKNNTLLNINNNINNYNNKLQNINLNSNIINKNNRNNNINDIKELLNNNKINLSDNLINKYLVGLEFGYKGKFGSSWGKRRSNKFLFKKGTFRNSLIEHDIIKHQIFKYNYIKPSISNAYVGKHTFSGKVGIKLTLNRI